MIARSIASVLAAFALATAPLAVHARLLLVSSCTGAAHLLVIPVDPAVPQKGDRDDCAKACHAVLDRRDKATEKKGCCA
ncbi:hypothetical protein [Sphingobium subterraneum]|uniref:Uncharacterized protein n=1 Tax=Sphingobium subterraneum TaxID=627688 RepID=A0A841J2G5_9SPHN|nr:hypothetical protein [Sphingobium subterraneum]MBB6124860.1 hypothetical protein [Sphingobium subterraneum]